MCQRLVYFVCACRLEDSARHKKQEFLRTFKSSCNAINDRSFTRAHHISYQPLPCKGSATCVAIIDGFDLISPAKKACRDSRFSEACLLIRKKNFALRPVRLHLGVLFLVSCLLRLVFLLLYFFL